MQLIFGPSNSRYTYTGSPVPHNDLAYEIAVNTLGEALAAYELRFNATIVPFAGNPDDPHLAELKYFTFQGRGQAASSLVDIHIHRDGKEICPKQDLNFRLLAGDLVEIGQLIC